MRAGGLQPSEKDQCQEREGQVEQPATRARVHVPNE
jgi:hypothetical protein